MCALWAQSAEVYPRRQGNKVKILIDGQAAYGEIADAFQSAREFIYMTISYGDQDFLLKPPDGPTMFDILRSRCSCDVDVRMVVWKPGTPTADTIPDPVPAPAPGKSSGVNAGPGSIQARWDIAKGYTGSYTSPHGFFEPTELNILPEIGCHHQKTYVMDDGAGGCVAFVGGINPVQSYWDTPSHDMLNSQRVPGTANLQKWLEDNPPLHDVFYEITGPAVADVIANFIERYNGATIPHAGVTDNAKDPFAANPIQSVPGGIEVQVLRTIAPNTYPALPNGVRGIRELHLNALRAAGEGSLVYIENQYFFDHGIISEIRAAADRGAKVIAILESKPDQGTVQGEAERILERFYGIPLALPLIAHHDNVSLLTLGNNRPDPRIAVNILYSETYIHSKTMAVLGPDWAIMTGGSANIAFTSMWFHSEMNIAITDTEHIQRWLAQLWAEHLNISPAEAMALVTGSPDNAFFFFTNQAARNETALRYQGTPDGRVYSWWTSLPERQFNGITLPLPTDCGQE